MYIEGIAKSEQDEKCTDLTRTCNLNLAQVYMKLENYTKVISYSTNVLWMDRDSVKALYRRAQAYDLQGFYDEAITDLNRLIEVNSDNVEAKRLLEVVKSHKQKKSEKEKVSMRTVFKQIEDKYALDAANEEASKSVWEDATETCPDELATEDAYKVYREVIDEEERVKKAEAAAKQAEYEAANPPKKKKKKKKKKKPAISEVAISEMEEIKPDEDKPEVIPEPDEGMTYAVTAEKTFVNKIGDIGDKDGASGSVMTSRNKTNSTVPVEAAPDKAAPGPDNVAPDKPSPDNADPDNSAPDEAAPDEAAPDHAAPDKAAPHNAVTNSADKSAADDQSQIYPLGMKLTQNSEDKPVAKLQDVKLDEVEPVLNDVTNSV